MRPRCNRCSVRRLSPPGRITKRSRAAEDRRLPTRTCGGAVVLIAHSKSARHTHGDEASSRGAPLPYAPEPVEMRRRIAHPPAGCTSTRHKASPKRTLTGLYEAGRLRRRHTPAFCGSSPIFTCTRRLRHAALPSRLASQRSHRPGFGPVQALDDIRQIATASSRLVGLQPADEVQTQRRILRSRKSTNFPAASCTRFSPNTIWPACSASSTACAGCIFETATRVMSASLRPARAAAAAIRSRTRARLSAIEVPGADVLMGVFMVQRLVGRTPPGQGTAPACACRIGHDAVVLKKPEPMVGRGHCAATATLFRKCHVTRVMSIAARSAPRH